MVGGGEEEERRGGEVERLEVRCVRVPEGVGARLVVCTQQDSAMMSFKTSMELLKSVKREPASRIASTWHRRSDHVFIAC